MKSEAVPTRDLSAIARELFETRAVDGFDFRDVVVGVFGMLARFERQEREVSLGGGLGWSFEIERIGLAIPWSRAVRAARVVSIELHTGAVALREHHQTTTL
jgi:hypothetical protein